jgi:hypothetical protein
MSERGYEPSGSYYPTYHRCNVVQFITNDAAPVGARCGAMADRIRRASRPVYSCAAAPLVGARGGCNHARHVRFDLHCSFERSGLPRDPAHHVNVVSFRDGYGVT